MNVDVNFMKMREFAYQSAAAGKPIVDDDLILHILGGFGADFDAVVVNIANRPYNLNLQEVQFAFQAHEVRMQNLVLFTYSSANIAYKSSAVRGNYNDSPKYSGGRFGRGSGGGRAIIC